jgi:hypothetical protein
MTFINPTEMSNIPTYRVMDSDGVLVDKSRKSIDVPKEEILAWYKNMLTGWVTYISCYRSGSDSSQSVSWTSSCLKRNGRVD